MKRGTHRSTWSSLRLATPLVSPVPGRSQRWAELRAPDFTYPATACRALHCLADSASRLLLIFKLLHCIFGDLSERGVRTLRYRAMLSCGAVRTLPCRPLTTLSVRVLRMQAESPFMRIDASEETHKVLLLDNAGAGVLASVGCVVLYAWCSMRGAPSPLPPPIRVRPWSDRTVPWPTLAQVCHGDSGRRYALCGAG